MVEMGIETTKAEKAKKWVSKGIQALLGGFLGLWLKYQRNSSLISNWYEIPICSLREDLAKF